MLPSTTATPSPSPSWNLIVHRTKPIATKQKNYGEEALCMEEKTTKEYVNEALCRLKKLDV